IVAGIVTLVVVDVVLLRRSKQPVVSAKPASEKIGLYAHDEGDALRLQWNQTSPTIRDASHAILYIKDGNFNKQLDLTDKQLAAASVRYWPEADSVSFRLEVYRWDGSTSETVVAPRPLHRVQKSL